MSPARTRAACLAASFEAARIAPAITRPEMLLTDLREAIHTAVTLTEQASANYANVDALKPERELHAAELAALEARDDMRQAFEAIGIDRKMLLRLWRI